MIRSSMRASKLAVLAAVAVMALIFGSATANAATCYPGTFTDVPPDHPFYADITWMANEGISTGYDDCTFRPSLSITRQAMSAFIYRYAGSPAVPVGAPTFPDVPASNPFYDAIRWMASEGITTGYDDGTFKPANLITRQAMSAFLYRLAGEPVVPGGVTPFPDVPAGHRFYDPIMWMSAAGITTGYPDGTFRPTNNTTRQAMAAFMHRYDTNVGAPMLALSTDLDAQTTVAQRSTAEQLTDSTGVRLAVIVPLLAGALLLTNRRRSQA